MTKATDLPSQHGVKGRVMWKAGFISTLLTLLRYYCGGTGGDTRKLSLVGVGGLQDRQRRGRRVSAVVTVRTAASWYVASFFKTWEEAWPRVTKGNQREKNSWIPSPKRRTEGSPKYYKVKVSRCSPLAAVTRMYNWSLIVLSESAAWQKTNCLLIIESKVALGTLGGWLSNFCSFFHFSFFVRK